MKFINEWREYKKPKSDYYTKRVNINKMELEDICSLLGIKDDPIFISSGRYGNAYKIGDKVLKITTDLVEAKTVSSIIESGIDNPSIVKYYSINRYKLKGYFVYVIVMDFVETLKDYLNKYKYKSNYIEFISDCLDIIYNNRDIKSKEDIIKRLLSFGWNHKHISSFWVNRVWNFYSNIVDKHIDTHIDNMGIRNGELVMFDYRRSDRVSKFDEPKIIGNAS